MTEQLMDERKADAFAERMVGVLNEGSLALMASIGHRTGLFDAMAGLGHTTTDRLAAAAGLNERYVREWLGAMAAAGVVEHRAEDRTYRLPPEHAACLTRAASPNNLAAFAQYVAVLGAVEDEVVDSFHHGRGVPYASYRRFHQVMAEDSAQTVVSALREHILPLVPGLTGRLTDGIDVLDVGCGAGRALVELAGSFPNSRFTGLDLSEEAVGAGRAEARRRGLTNVRLEIRDAAEPFGRDEFDLVTAFDAIHDQARPQAVLANVHAALRPGGTFLMQDIAASSHVHLNLEHPVGTFLYTISTMHCMSVSLAAGGPGLGAMWGREQALEMLREAGFGGVRVEQLAHDFQNYYYVTGR